MSTLSVVESVFLAALEKGTPQMRAAYLDEACGADANLRACVERLLDAHPKAGRFLEAPAPGLPLTADHAPLAEKPGSVIGPYKLLQELGEGGFGVVFMAEQTEPVRRKVALKVIKPGMDSRQVVARFEQERQALAMMDHPNIARVFDGGTTESGRPYFVMELVKGVPITRFCDDNRLSPRERLELFAQVCAAIQHAHTKGVIHRDVKPSNVLVTIYDGKPSVKVIDFGVAKAVSEPMTDKTLFTRHGQVIGTLEYMSPEQASLDSLDADTRSDVYALGVLLYELLTGSTPLDKEKLRAAGFAEMLRLIREEEPPLPSVKLSTSGQSLPALAAYRKTESAKLPRLVRGELDWIAMRALEKDRARRYQSALGLAEDVGRYLRDEQVLACPPSLGYRAGKYARKHKAAFTLAGTAAALLLLGAVVSGWQAWNATVARRDADSQRDTAQRERDDANNLRIAAEAAETKEKAARLATRRAFYAQSMTLIPIAWEADDTRRVAQLLDGLRPKPDEEDLRGFEWHYWDRQLHPELRSVAVAQTLANGAALSGDGMRRAALSGDGMRVAIPCDAKKDGDPVLKVIEPASGKVLFSLPAREGRRQVCCLTLSHDGRRLALLRQDPDADHSRPVQGLLREFVEVWDVGGAGDRPLFSRKAQRASFLDRLAFSPAGNRLVTAEGGERLTVPLEERKKPWADKDTPPTVKVWDLTTPNAEAIFQPEAPFGYSPLWAFSPDGARLAIAHSGKTGKNRVVEDWDLATGKLRAQIPDSGFSEGIAYSPDGKRLVGVGPRWGGEKNEVRVGSQLRVLDDQDGSKPADKQPTPAEERLQSKRRPKGPAWTSPRHSPDGKLLAVCDQDVGVRLLDALSGKEVRVFKTIGRPIGAAFGEGGKRLYALVSDQKSARVNQWSWVEWDLPTAQESRSPSEPKKTVQKGKRMSDRMKAAQKVAYERSSEPSRAIVRWEPQLWNVRLKDEEVTVRSPDGERIATYDTFPPVGGQAPINQTTAITVTDSDGKRVCVFRGHRSRISSVTFSPNGRFVLSKCMNQPVIKPEPSGQVWEVVTGKVLREINVGFTHPRMLWSTDFDLVSPDGRWLVLPGDKDVSVVNFDDPDPDKEKERFNVGDAKEAYFADARHLVCVHRKGKLPTSPISEIKVWDVEAGRELSSHSPDEVELAFGSDGGYFLVRKQEESTALEEIGGKERRIRLKGTGDAGEFRMVRFSPDGARLVTANRMWDANSGEELYRIEGPSVISLNFSPDGKRIVGYVTREATPPGEDSPATSSSAVKVWDVATGQVLLTLRVGSGIGRPKFSPDGHRLLLPSRADPKAATVWDATPREAKKGAAEKRE